MRRSATGERSKESGKEGLREGRKGRNLILSRFGHGGWAGKVEQTVIPHGILALPYLRPHVQREQKSKGLSASLRRHARHVPYYFNRRPPPLC